MDDNELRQAMAALESYKAQLDALAQQSQMLQMSLEETLRSKETIKALIEAEPGDEVLVPAGGAAFVTVTVSEKKKAIVGIGSGYSVEKDFDDAVSFVDANVEDIKTAAKSVAETAGRIEETATKLSLAVNQELQKRQG
mgnify:CR=1 FL=1